MSKRVASFILALAVLLSAVVFPAPAAVGFTLPDTIRVGLYYKGHPGGSTPVSSIKISSQAGIILRIGYGSSSLDLGPVFSEYAVFDRAAGQYHVGIGGEFGTYADAQTEQLRLADGGVDTVVAYDGKWKLWSGVFGSSAEASDAMAKIDAGTLAKKVIQPSSYRISCSCNGRVVFYYDMSATGLQAAPAGSAYLTLNDTGARTYRGVIELRRFTDSDMTVVNVLPFEQYLYGVVPNEIERTSGAEALKAQAVAARTYAARSLNTYPAYGFDVSDTVYDQVYKGVPYDSKECSAAVDATAGRLLWYGSSLVDAYYFSCANGFTEDPVNVFGLSKEYLKSVDSTFESPSSYLYSWTVSFSADGLARQLRSKGISIGSITGIRVGGFSKAGRVTSMTFTGTAGSKTVTNSSCRNTLDLHSQQFTIEIGNGDGTATLYYPVSAEAAASITPSTAVSQAADATRFFLRSITFASLRMAMEGRETDIEGRSLILGAAGLEDTRGHYITDYVGAAASPPAAQDSFFKTALPYTGQAGQKTVSSILGAGEVRISGKGWGHAVGMSQDGATALAALGYSYVEILEHYYSGASVK